MAYCTYSDVQAEFKDITFSSTTAVKDSEVTEFIVQADARINAEIGKVYETPLASGEGLSLLKMISLQIVSKRIHEILKVKSGSDETDQKGSEEEEKDTPEKLLARIVSSDLKLVGATYLRSGNGVKSYTNDNAVSHLFERDVASW
jgi:hypothetical protein